MVRLLLLLPTTTYRTHDFMAAAAALEVAVVVGSERRQALAAETPGSTLVLDFARPAASVDRIVAFDREYPVRTVVGVDDETVVLAAMACKALGLPHNSVASVRASRYKHIMRRMLAEKRPALARVQAFFVFRKSGSRRRDRRLPVRTETRVSFCQPGCDPRG